MRLRKRTSAYVLIAVLLPALTGCATTTPPPAIPRPPHPELVHPALPGIYHTVSRGETLWSISRDYNIPLDMLVEHNKIPDAAVIETGQKLHIPDRWRGRKEPQYAGTKQAFVWPYRGNIVGYFGAAKENVRNQGIDIAARAGEPVVAAAEGKVIFTSDNLRGYGKTIIIQHDRTFSTVYTCNQTNLVKTGDCVGRGQPIARAGTSGRTTRCAVHFQIRKDNKPQNPLHYLPK